MKPKKITTIKKKTPVMKPVTIINGSPSRFEVGMKIRFKNIWKNTRPEEDKQLNVNEYEILAVDDMGYGYLYEKNNPKGISGEDYKGFTWSVDVSMTELIVEEPPKTVLIIGYDEPETDEFDDNCVLECRPTNHACGK